MADHQVSRVRYYDQQILRRQDFEDEQAYHLAMRRRHNIGSHLWGIVYGLEIEIGPEPEKELSVQPGLAIDGYGRELILAQYQPIDSFIFDNEGSDTLDVYLVYAQQSSDDAPRGFNGCMTNGQGRGNRLQETAKLDISKAIALPLLQPGVDVPERRQPPGVPPDDLRFSPVRVPPDDPTQQWPVFLGQIRRGQDKPDLRGRPYAGLRGEMVRASSEWVWLQVGEWPNNEYRFGVFLADPLTDAEADKQGSELVPESPPLRRRAPILGITMPDVTANGADVRPTPAVELRADTTLYGDLIIESGAVEFGAGPPDLTAKPWRIYHAITRPEAVANQQHEMRIEMAADGADGSTNEVVIGRWSEQSGGFEPCLTIAGNGDVTAHRNLEVNGNLITYDRPDVTPEELIRFVVDRKTNPADDETPWLGTLVAELRAGDGLLGKLVAVLLSGENTDIFLDTLAGMGLSELIDKLTARRFVEDFVKDLVERAKGQANANLREHLLASIATAAMEAPIDVDLTRELGGERAMTFLPKIVNAAWDARADDPPWRATVFDEMLLDDLVQKLREDDYLLPEFVETVKAQGFEQALIDALTRAQPEEVSDAELQRCVRQLHYDLESRRSFATLTLEIKESLKSLWDAIPAIDETDLVPESEPVDLRFVADALAKDQDLQVRFVEFTTAKVRNSLTSFWRRYES